MGLRPDVKLQPRGPSLAHALERKGCSVKYLPPYSPDLIPKRRAYFKLKSILRKLAERPVAGRRGKSSWGRRLQFGLVGLRGGPLRAALGELLGGDRNAVDLSFHGLQRNCVIGAIGPILRGEVKPPGYAASSRQE